MKCQRAKAIGTKGRYAKNIMHVALGSRQCNATEFQLWRKHMYWDEKCNEQAPRLHMHGHV